MPSPFAAALATADVDLDAHMGETIRILPVVAGDFGRSPDPAREAFDVVALVGSIEPHAVDAAKMAARFAYEEHRAEIRRALIAGREIRKEDEVHRIAFAGTPRYKVSHVDRTDPERIFVHLTVLPGSGA